MPFAVSFDTHDHLVVAKAGPNALATFAIHDDGTVTQIDTVSTGQAGTCWGATDGTHFSASNAGSASVSGYTDHGNGSLTALGITVSRYSPGVDTGNVNGLPAVGRSRIEILLAVAAFAVLCVVALSFAPILMEPDDFAYNASIIAITHGHFLSLSAAQVQALLPHLTAFPGDLRFAGGPGAAGGPGGTAPPVIQWVQLSGGRWISEKDPGYPFLAAPFQLFGIMRLAPLFYGALGCAGLYVGARRWLGPFGGTVAVALFCSSGAALFFAWRDYMPTFTEASLIAAGTGALLWAVLAAEVSVGRRTWAGLAGFVAVEAAVFVRYTDVVVLGCAVVAVAATWRLRPAKLPTAAVRAGSARSPCSARVCSCSTIWCTAVCSAPGTGPVRSRSASARCCPTSGTCRCTCSRPCPSWYRRSWRWPGSSDGR